MYDYFIKFFNKERNKNEYFSPQYMNIAFALFVCWFVYEIYLKGIIMNMDTYSSLESFLIFIGIIFIFCVLIGIFNYLFDFLTSKSSFYKNIFSYNLTSTISGKTFTLRIIILIILETFFLAYLEKIPAELLDYFTLPSGKLLVSKINVWILLSYWMYYFFCFYIQILFLNTFLKRLNAVFMNSIKTIKIIFNVLCICTLYFFIIEIDIPSIGIIPAIKFNLQTIDSFDFPIAFCYFLIILYLIFKNSTITDSKQHEG